MKQTPPKKTRNNETGAQGESIAAVYLERQGYTIIERNYRQKWGEIDLIVRKADSVHFVEVKTVSYETKHDLETAVSYGTWRPEENVHAFKLKKLARTIETWLARHKWTGKWQIDVAGVRIVPRETFATIKILDNVIVE